jgi:hypothetical protein
MNRILAFAGLALTLTTLPAAAQMVTISPQQIGQIFCISRLANDMAPVQGLLTPALTQAIADAEKSNADWEARNPGEKPPLGDGIPWQTWQDYAPECTVGAPGPQGSAELHYHFPDAPDADFVDTLLLVRVEDPSIGQPVWRIDNVKYSDGGDLRAALLSAFAN